MVKTNSVNAFQWLNPHAHLVATSRWCFLLLYCQCYSSFFPPSPQPTNVLQHPSASYLGRKHMKHFFRPKLTRMDARFIDKCRTDFEMWGSVFPSSFSNARTPSSGASHLCWLSKGIKCGSHDEGQPPLCFFVVCFFFTFCTDRQAFCVPSRKLLLEMKNKSKHCEQKRSLQICSLVDP